MHSLDFELELWGPKMEISRCNECAVWILILNLKFVVPRPKFRVKYRNLEVEL